MEDHLGEMKKRIVMDEDGIAEDKSAVRSRQERHDLLSYLVIERWCDESADRFVSQRDLDLTQKRVGMFCELRATSETV
jgi:hypothetical protein